MIASLTGKILRKGSDHVVLDVHGVGYRVLATPMTLGRLPANGAVAALEIHTAVREDDISLYGFLELSECRLFVMLLTVNGVGPKLALTILSHCAWQELVGALQREDVNRLKSIKGVGEKTAKMLVLGLKKKVQEFHGASGGEVVLSQAASGLLSLTQDAEAALLGLGYSRPEVQKTLSALDLSAAVSLQSVIKQSLQLLSGSVGVSR